MSDIDRAPLSDETINRHRAEVWARLRQEHGDQIGNLPSMERTPTAPPQPSKPSKPFASIWAILSRLTAPLTDRDQRRSVSSKRPSNVRKPPD
jgi:hypothetical protein